MKLRITGGTIDCEIVEGSMSIDDVKSMLKKLAVQEEKDTTEGIKGATAKISPHSSKSNMQGKLNAKPRMPI